MTRAKVSGSCGQRDKISCLVGLGSNLGDSLSVLQGAWRAIGDFEGIEPKKLSSPYRTSPVGMDSKNVFVNCAGMLHTELAPVKLLELFLQLEADFGRKRKTGAGYQDRILDIDLLYYGDVCLDSDQLTIPHPRIAERLFVLTPLVELSSDWRDPKTHLAVSEMEQRLRDLMNEEQIELQAVDMIKWKGND